MEFIHYGCYIVEPTPKPEYMGLSSRHVVSASQCICNHHPSLQGSFWMESEQEQRRYKQQLQLTDREFDAMRQRIGQLFEAQMLDVDCCFVNCSDALDFQWSYLYRLPHLKVISLAFHEGYQKQLLEELASTSNPPHQFSGQRVGGTLLGYELLGWDFSGFHSFLCNGLERVILQTEPLVVDQYSLLQNSYAQVQTFCDMIQVQGEPVLWMPFAVFELS